MSLSMLAVLKYVIQCMLDWITRWQEKMKSNRMNVTERKLKIADVAQPNWLRLVEGFLSTQR